MADYQRPNIERMEGYTWGEQPDDQETIKLNTNENPYPASPAVDAALQSVTAASLRRYPQPTADALRDAIASQHDTQRNQIVITNGGDEALRLALTTFVEPGAPIAVAEPSYSLYPVLADIHDARVFRIDLDSEWQLADDFARQANEAGAQLTCIVNPHAPSGTLLSYESLDGLAKDLNGVLLIDEAYVDFVDPEIAYSAIDLINKHDNVLILRTFSKGYSLAGMRLGYLLGSANLIDPIVTKTRDSYNIDHVSQLVGLAAFTDQTYANETWNKVREQRALVGDSLHQLGLTCVPSQANFLLATVGDHAKLTAKELYEALKARGVLVRYFSTERLADKLRISIGSPEENDKLLSHLTDLLNP